MSHVDEGTLHAYADGELTSRQQTEVEAHLSLCADCQARLEEARAAIGRASELLAELEPGPMHAPAWREMEERASARAREAPRRSWLKPSLAAAAMIAIAFGIGWFSRASLYDAALRPELTSSAPAAWMPAAGDKPSPQSVVRQSEARNRAIEADVPNELTLTEQAEVGEAGGRAKTEGGVDRAAQTAAAKSVPAGEAAREADRLEPPAEEQPVPVIEPAEPPADLRQRELEAAQQRRDEPQPSPALPERVQSELERSRAALSAFRPQTLTDEAKREFAVAVQLDEAAIWLGARVRTLPDLELVGAEVVPGSVIEEGVPGLPAVRLSYRDATGQSIILDQQWLGGQAGFAEPEVPAFLMKPNGQRAYRWDDEGGYRLILRGTISSDSLRALAGRLN